MSNNTVVPLTRLKGAALPGLVINGKFLQPSTSRSGVYRVAREQLLALDKLLASNPALGAAMSCRLLIPGGGDADLRFSCIRVETQARQYRMPTWMLRLSSKVWEQVVLPRRAGGDTLLNLCNIGPVVYRNAFTMVHDAQVYSAPNSYSRAFRIWYRLMLPMLGKRNKALLTVSQYSRMQLAQFGVAAAPRIRVIHNGCDHVLRLVPDASKLETSDLAGDRYVVALANTQPHKNIAVLFKAFASPALRDVTLALFGPGKRKDFEAQGHTVPSNVKFLGFVSDEQLAGLLQQAVALAFPSTTEGFGLPPLEAMTLGCPAIAAPCGALPEVCGDAVLWADAHAPDQWAKQILRLCDDRHLRAQMQDRGKAQAALFTWDRAVHHLLETVLGHALAETGLMQTQAAHAPAQVHVEQAQPRQHAL